MLHAGKSTTTKRKHRQRFECGLLALALFMLTCFWHRGRLKTVTTGEPGIVLDNGGWPAKEIALPKQLKPRGSLDLGRACDFDVVDGSEVCYYSQQCSQLIVG